LVCVQAAVSGCSAMEGLESGLFRSGDPLGSDVISEPLVWIAATLAGENPYFWGTSERAGVAAERS